MPLRDAQDGEAIGFLLRTCQEVIAFLTDTDEPGFYRNGLLISAVCFKVSVLGEAVGRLSAGLRQRTPDIRWHAIRNMRNRLIHGYDKIDLPQVWRSAKFDVPVLLEQLSEIRDREFSES